MFVVAEADGDAGAVEVVAGDDFLFDEGEDFVFLGAEDFRFVHIDFLLQGFDFVLEGVVEVFRLGGFDQGVEGCLGGGAGVEVLGGGVGHEVFVFRVGHMEVAVDGLVFKEILDGVAAEDVVVEERDGGPAVGVGRRFDVGGDAAVGVFVEGAVIVAVAVVDGLDAAAARRVVFAGGDFQLAVVGHRADRLDEALAVGAGTGDGGAAQVLQGAGGDFGGGGGVAVDQHQQGHQGVDRRIRGAVFPGQFGHAAFGGDHERSLRNEERDDVDGFVHHAAAVVAQVDDQALGAGFLEPQHVGLEFFGDLGREAVELDVADVVAVQAGIADIRHVDPFAGDDHVDRVFRAAFDDLEFHLGAGLALHPAGALLGSFFVDGDSVDLEDDVAGLEAGLGGRGVLIRLDDADALAGRLADQGADAAVVAGGQQFEVFPFFFGDIDRIGIEGGEHRPQARDDHFVEVDRIDIRLGDFLQGGIFRFEALAQFEILALGGRLSADGQ